MSWRFRNNRFVIVCLGVVAAILLPIGISGAMSSDEPCQAIGATWAKATAAYADNCEQPRADCDPIDTGWLCSSQQITGDATGPVASTPPNQPEPCQAYGDTYRRAVNAYADNCEPPRVDCDPVDGQWVCSSERIGANSPKSSVVVTLAPTSTTIKAPTTGPSTTAPSTTAPSTSAPKTSAPKTTQTSAPTTEAPTTQAPTTEAPTTTTTRPTTTTSTKPNMPGMITPNLPNGFLKGANGTSELQIINMSRDTRDIPANIATFRMDCLYSHMNFDDAIVNPGQRNSTHLHAYFGNTSVDANSNPMNLVNEGNSTCAGGRANRSAYWVPAVIDTNDGNRVLQPDSAVIYYKSGWDGGKPANVVAPPNGLRIVSGNAKATSLVNDRNIKGGNPYTFACIKKQRVDKNRESDTIPTNCRSGDMLLLRVEFPQCWDGKNLDSADHNSHMAYLTGYPNRRQDCPSSHPVLIPKMTINAYFKLNSLNTTGLRLSSDMYSMDKPGGYSAHADWIVGWDQKIMQRVLDGCFQPADDCGHNNFNDGQGLRYPRR